MAIKGIHFKSLVLAGVVAGYIMFFVDKWFNGFLGLFGLFPGTSNPWWMLEHHLESILFALLFAWPAVYYRLPGPGWTKGLVFGLAWDILVWITSAISGSLGASIFENMPMTAPVMVTEVLLHLIWGFFLGVLYNPTLPRESALHEA
jgi:hypothetical protein